MTQSTDAVLSDRITAWIRGEGGDQAVVFVTVDASSRPHVVLLARDEVAVVSPARLRVALGTGSRSGENLSLRGAATLALYGPDLACIIKTRSIGTPKAILPTTGAWDLAIEDVRFDRPGTTEGAARLVTGLRFEGRPERADLREALNQADPAGRREA